MQNINSVSELKAAIQLLEVEQSIKGQQLKEQLYITYESLRPVNILRKTLNEIISFSYQTDNISGGAIGLISGLLSKKLFIGKSGNVLRKLLGSVLQFGVMNIITHNSDVIKSIGHAILQLLFPKKEMT